MMVKPSVQELLEKVEYYINSGADMIDIGMHAGENNPEKAFHMIKIVKDNYVFLIKTMIIDVINNFITD